MKMIKLLNMVAEGKIKDGAKMVVIDERGKRYKYVYMLLNGDTFVCNDHRTPNLARRYPHSRNFLNLEVELVDWFWSGIASITRRVKDNENDRRIKYDGWTKN